MPKIQSHRGVLLGYSTLVQQDYIEKLFIDCGFNTSPSRKDFLFNRFKVHFPYELTGTQASTVIEELKDLKSRNKYR